MAKKKKRGGEEREGAPDDGDSQARGEGEEMRDGRVVVVVAHVASG